MDMEDFSHLVKPTVNLNGTSRDNLMLQYIDALNAFDTLRAALSAMAPHGRDYQTAPVGAYRTARTQHERRQKTIEVVRQEIEHLAEKL